MTAVGRIHQAATSTAASSAVTASATTIASAIRGSSPMTKS